MRRRRAAEAAPFAARLAPRGRLAGPECRHRKTYPRPFLLAYPSSLFASKRDHDEWSGRRVGGSGVVPVRGRELGPARWHERVGRDEPLLGGSQGKTERQQTFRCSRRRPEQRRNRVRSSVKPQNPDRVGEALSHQSCGTTRSGTEPRQCRFAAAGRSRKAGPGRAGRMVMRLPIGLIRRA